MLVRLMGWWKGVLWPDGARLLPAAKCAASRRDDYDAIFLFCTEPAKAKERITDEMNAVDAIAMVLPIVALSPIAETYLPEPLLRSSPVRLQLPKLDAAVITRTIRIVTGKRCRAKVEDDLIAKISFGDFLVAVRFGRSPEECIAVLRRLADEKADKRKSRDLTLDELHGLPDAVAWAKSTIADLAAWKRGEIVWDQIDGGAVLNGPPGTGKTTFARVFASEAGIPMVAGTLAKWLDGRDRRSSRGGNEKAQT